MEDYVIFYMLDIKLCHCWLADPQDPSYQEIIKRKEGDDIISHSNTYNDLTSDIIKAQQLESIEDPYQSIGTSKDAEKFLKNEEITRKALIYEKFLEESQSQVTYYGLQMLGAALPPDSIAILFRNNHFSTLFKHTFNKNFQNVSEYELLCLVTDVGYSDMENIVWETLSNTEGDSHFLSGNFVDFDGEKNKTDSFGIPQNQDTNVGSSVLGSVESIEDDYNLAMALQEEESRGNSQDIEPKQKKNSCLIS
jgi:hypothetical protein